MFKVEVMISPHRLAEVQQALARLGVDELTVVAAQEYGTLPGPQATYRGLTYDLPFVQSLRVEMLVADSALEVVLEHIAAAAFAREHAHGKILVTELHDVLQIRDGRPQPRSPAMRPNRDLAVESAAAANRHSW